MMIPACSSEEDSDGDGDGDGDREREMEKNVNCVDEERDVGVWALQLPRSGAG